MSLKLPKFSNILDDIGGAATNVVHAIGNAAGSAVDHALPGNQSSLHPTLSQPQPPVAQSPQLPRALGGSGLGGFGNFGNALDPPASTTLRLVTNHFANPPIGATSTPDPNQQPLQVGTAHVAQLQAPAPQKPNGQPLTATVVRTPSLQVGNQQIAQSPTARSGVAPAPAPPTGVVGIGKGLVSADKYLANNLGLAQVAKIVNPVGSSSDKLEAAKQLASGVATFPIKAGEQLGNTVNYATGAPQQSKLTIGPIHLNNVSPSLQNQYQQTKKTNGVIPAALETAFSAASDVAPLLGVSELGKGTETKAVTNPVTQNPFLARLTPLNEVGAIGRDVTPEGEQIANDNHSPAPPETTSPTGANTNLGDSRAVGQGNSVVTPQDQQMFKSLGGNPDDLPNLLKLNDQQKADLDTNTQKALDNFQKGNTPLAPAEENTAKNPFKSMIQPVNQGDYGQAIANGQVASKPVDLATTQWQNAMKRLNPDETKNFWKSVEDPTNPNHSPNVQEAINRWNQATNRVHANSQALGGNTNYVTNYARHPWELPEELTNGAINGAGKNFSGLNNVSRKYQTIAEGEQAGLKLSDNPLEEGTRFLKASSSALRREALKQGLATADSGAEIQPHTLDLGFGHTVQLSDKGRTATKGVEFRPVTSNKAVKVVRKGQQNLKTGLLSASQFHPINISLLRAAPTLAAEGHPIAAVKGAVGTFRGAVGNTYTDRLISKAVEDGTADKAALIGAPYGGNEAGGFSLGEHTVFGKQMPVMHDQVVRSVISDLEKKGIPLNSPQARAAGDTANKLMGFMNAETNRISTRVQQGMRDFLLAGQFTPSKFGIAKNALTKGGVAGSYARRTIAANVGALAAVGGGIGLLTHQKSDNVRDTLLRAIFDPAVPTPLKDAKGNTEKLRLPGGDTSDFAKLLGFKLVRGQNGHLDVNWKPSNMPSTVEDYLRARLAPVAGTALKVATNTSYSGKPLYDPASSLGDRIGQGVASVVAGSLPIGLQGLAYTKAVKDHVPNSVKEVLDAQTPGTNPVLKSIGSSFGLTPATDQTVGKGQQSAQYYSALDEAKSGLNSDEKSVLQLVTGSKKNPVTGQYDVQQTVYDSPTKAEALLKDPKVLDKIIGLNQKLQSQGQKTDPLYNLPKDQIISYLQHQTDLPGSAEARQWSNDNKNWYNGFSKQRSQFFDSLPAGDPNKPKAPIEYPDVDANTQSSMDGYSNITDPTQKAQYLAAHPEVSDAFAKQAQYTNEIRVARGAPALKGYPEPDNQTNADLKTYNNLASGAKSAFIRSHPNVSNYFTQTSLYGLENDAALDQFKGNTPTQKELKGIYNVGNYDVSKNADGTYSLTNGNTAGGSGGSYGFTGYSNGSSISNTAQNINNINTTHKAPHINTKLSVRVRGKGGKAKVARTSKPKTLKVASAKGTLV